MKPSIGVDRKREKRITPVPITLRLRIATNLMYLLALAWAVFAAGWLFFSDDRMADLKYLYGPFGLAVALFFVVLAFLIRRRKLLAWKISIFAVAFTIVLVLSETLGRLEISYMAVAGLTMLMLLIARPGLLKPQEPEVEEESEGEEGV